MHFKLTEFFDQAAKAVHLAKLASELMSRVRKGHESDKETLTRVVEEYRACKYEGVPIPGGKAHKCV